MSTDKNDLDEQIASVVSTLIQVADPRQIVNALLVNAASIAHLILLAGKGTPAQVVQAFTGALVDALIYEEKPKEESRIQVVPAGTVPSKRP